MPIKSANLWFPLFLLQELNPRLASAQMMMNTDMMGGVCRWSMGNGGLILGSIFTISASAALIALTVYLIKKSRI